MKNIYWLNKESRQFLAQDYLKKGQSAEERIREIAETAEEILKEKGFADKFEGMMYKGWFSLSSPIWANFGAGRGLSISCNGSWVKDTLDAIIYKTAETAMLTKHGAGTSAYFGELRPRGAKISTGGESSGPVHFLELFETVTNVVSQSSVRRGSFAAYLPIDHPDIEDFLGIRGIGHPIQELSFGVCVSNAWMDSMIEGDKAKRKIWAKVITKRFETGYPYIFFSDTVNNNAPDVYKDKGHTIYASNLCVTGDTLIEVKSEDDECIVLRIQDLGFYLQKHSRVFVKSYNIDSKKVIFSEITDFAQTGISTDLIEIEDEKGNIIKCTPEHKIFTKNRGYVEAQFLEETDILENNS